MSLKLTAEQERKLRYAAEFDSAPVLSFPKEDLRLIGILLDDCAALKKRCKKLRKMCRDLKIILPEMNMDKLSDVLTSMEAIAAGESI